MSSVFARPLGPRPKELFGYEIIDYLGEGAHSVIYAAASPVSKQICALKYVVIKGQKDDRWYQQLENEVDVGRWISHRGIRQPIELKANRDNKGRIIDSALVMEFFDGQSIGKRIRPSMQTIVKVFILTADALAALHAIGFIHCDLKPGNIMVNDKRLVKVIDLGQACRIGTRKERIQGTPGYMAPEQASCGELTIQTDMFNFGASLYSVLCQLVIPSAADAHNSRAGEQTVPPHVLNPAIPQSLSDLIMECVNRTPAKRPGSMTEVIERLEASRDIAARRRRPERKRIDTNSTLD